VILWGVDQSLRILPEQKMVKAAGLQEMLIQSHAGFLELFPAIPSSWKDVSFKTMRA
jgi:alpha-L-fucosidase 2